MSRLRRNFDRGHASDPVLKTCRCWGIDDIVHAPKRKHRHAALRLAVTILITAKLIDWKNRWNP